MSNEKKSVENRVTFQIKGMCCAVEENLIRNKLCSLTGVVEVNTNTLKQQVTVLHTINDEDLIKKAIREIGFDAVPLGTAKIPDNEPIDGGTKNRSQWARLLFGGLAALSSELAELMQLYEPLLPASLAVIAFLVSGVDTFKSGLIALLHRNLNIHALMSLAVTGAMVLGHWPEAAMVLVLFSLAEHLEASSIERARNAISGIVALVPSDATVQLLDGTWQTMPVSTVQIGQLVRVKPGERISIDGYIVQGSTSIDQAAISGESIPVDKTVNDQVFAGTVNKNGEFVFRVSARSDKTLVSRIIHLVEEAQASRAPSQRFIDSFAQVYTPLVCLCAVLVAILPVLIFGANWQEWFYRSLVLLVIACPCALVIATPISIVSALAAAARAGIIIKGGKYLEIGKKIGHVVFDKTGTLTKGAPKLVDVLPLSPQNRKQILRIAFTISERSDHPVSQAIAYASELKDIERLIVSSLSAIPGRGIKASIDGVEYFLGSYNLKDELTLSGADPAFTILSTLEAEGKTCVILSSEKEILCVFAVADSLRESAVAAVDDLRASGIQTYILSGDNQKTVDAIAYKLKITSAFGNCMPQDKLKYLDSLCKTGETVAFIGDGINDSPALARADIGISLGRSGTGVAIETADVILMNDDLGQLCSFVDLAKKTSSVLVQNIIIALGIKLAFMALTFAGSATLWMAVFADLGASLIVIFNGLRLLRQIRKPS